VVGAQAREEGGEEEDAEDALLDAVDDAEILDGLEDDVLDADDALEVLDDDEALEVLDADDTLEVLDELEAGFALDVDEEVTTTDLTHFPFWHNWFLLHWFSHDPQLFLSELVSAQLPSHNFIWSFVLYGPHS